MSDTYGLGTTDNQRAAIERAGAKTPTKVPIYHPQATAVDKLPELLREYDAATAELHTAMRKRGQAQHYLTAAVLDAGMVECLSLNVARLRRMMK